MSRSIRKQSFSKVKNVIRGAYTAAAGKTARCAPRVKIPDLKKHKSFLVWCILLLFVSVFLDDPTMQQSRLKSYLHTLRWTPLPFGVGFALIAFQRYRFTRKREAQRMGQLEACDCMADEWEVEAYKLLPLRSFSRSWGWFNSIELPSWSRNSIIGSYARSFGCNMAEAEVESILEYRCLSEFFRRRLKPGVRPVDVKAPVTSPVDGTVLYKGTVSCGSMEQIKGVSYSAKRFLGPNCWSAGGPLVSALGDTDECFHKSCLRNPTQNDLYHIAIYLAPGDYHRFHSPTDWSVTFRRHFSGDLLSVNPAIVRWIKDLFVVNERVCYMGEWEHGFFSMTAVGATNVGSVLVPFDKNLKTNKMCWTQNRDFLDAYFDDGVERDKGEDFGEFNMGSTIVLIFEAPKNAEFNVVPGQRVQFGQSIFNLSGNIERNKPPQEISSPT